MCTVNCGNNKNYAKHLISTKHIMTQYRLSFSPKKNAFYYRFKCFYITDYIVPNRQKVLKTN